MAAGRPPFKAADMKGLYKKVCFGAYPPLPSRFSREFREVVAQMLTVNPQGRPDCEQLLTSRRVVDQVNQLMAFDLNVVNAIGKFYEMS